MHKHIFTLGLILTSIYTTTAMAWPTKEATDVWTNSGHSTRATMRCDSCCKTNCWLPSGTTYYDNKGTFTTSCSGEPAEPTCEPNRTYSVVSGQCKAGACVSGAYDIGFSSCISASESGSDYGYWEFNSFASNTTPYGLTAAGQWGVTFSYGIVKGIASCNSTPGTYGVTTTQNFSNTANGQYCWCKMTSPSASRWVFDYDLNDADDCAAHCALYCGMHVQYDSAFRWGVFGSVGN